MTTHFDGEPRSLDPRQLQAIKLGEPQSHRHITVFPLVTGEDGGPEYITLSEALADRAFTVAELSREGSVPELRVINSGGSAVLLLDGEELVGAKQNRVLNTSVLIPGKSETVIPVSCTEHGRWSYSSAFFAESGVVMSSQARAFKSSSVSSSLAASAKYSSDQSGVWAQIQELHRKAGTSSRTAAMLDAYKAREENLSRALNAFPPVTHQHGLLVVVNGQVVGLDWVSRGASYRLLHTKLLKSYVFDGLIEPGREELPPGELARRGEEFLKVVGSLSGKPFPSVGLGMDYRFSSEGVVGLALLCEERVIHMCFFRWTEDATSAGLAGLQARRRWHSR